MTSIKDFLQRCIDTWEQVHHPALMERFVIRQGVVCEARPFEGQRMTPQECFKNAMDGLFTTSGHGLMYCEGFGLRPNIPLLVHHAWLVTPDLKVVDPTWEKPEECQYVGVTYDRDAAWEIMQETGHYGLFDHGIGFNLTVALARDPGLIDFVPEQFVRSGQLIP